MNRGFPSNSKPTYTVDLSAKMEEFLHNVRLSEKYWSEENFEESLVKLRIAIKLGKFIIENESKGAVRDSFIQKLKQLLKRQQDRSKQVKQGKTIVHTNTTGGGSKNNSNNNNDDKLKKAINQTIVTQKLNVKWEDISGLQNAKNALKEAVILPIKFPEIFTGARKPWKGILLYGPSGTGKTFLGKACATEADGTFFSVSSSDLMSQYVGESEKLIKNLFNLAREKKPSIIFMDEIELLCGNRSGGQYQTSRRAKTEFLVQMQRVLKDDQEILVLAATYLPWTLDPAIRRTFQRRIYISLPEKQARYGILVKHFNSIENQFKQQDYQYFAERTDGFSGRDLSILVQEASYQPIQKLQIAKKFKKNQKGKLVPCDDHQTGPDVVQQNWLNIPKQNIQIPSITLKDMEYALKKTKPSNIYSELKQYEQFTKSFGQNG